MENLEEMSIRYEIEEAVKRIHRDGQAIRRLLLAGVSDNAAAAMAVFHERGILSKIGGAEK